ncbi:MAG: hypothetical protein ACYC2O_10585 [Microthrixaceae bacterium]
MDPQFFDGVAEACRGLTPAELGPVQVRSHRYGMKAWFGGAVPDKEHYEAQVVGAQHAPGASVLAVEVGFHAEHPKVEDNQAAVDLLLAAEPTWRRELGDQVVVGEFLGRGDRWRRASETWLDPNLDDDELVLDVALRLVDYFTAFEPLRRV